MQNDLSESRAAQLYGKAMKLAHAAINKHSSKLPDGDHIHHLAAAFIAGRHVTAGSGKTSSHVDRAGADSDQESMLEDNYGGGQGGDF